VAAEPSLKQLSRSSLAFEPQIGPALTDPAAPAAITRRRTRIAAWANQVVDMGLLTQTAEPPDGRQLGSRQTRQAVLALVNTGRFSPGRVSMESDRAPRCWFSQVPHFRPTAKI
jgi:hypothetical protein